MALAAGCLIAFAVLAVSLWHPRHSSGGLTQVGRDASITFDDGTVLTLTEPESDLDILRRRRMAGWGGHEYQQIFINADGTEMEVVNPRTPNSENSEDLDSGDHLMLMAYNRRVSKGSAPLDGKDGVVVADLHVDDKDKVAVSGADPKDMVVTDVIDSKDVVYHDSKDVLEQPVFALTTTSNPYGDQGVIGALMGDPGSLWGNIRTVSGGVISGGSGSGPGSGSVTTPPIGVAVPEPSTWSLVGLMGAAALAAGIVRRRRNGVA